MRLAVIGLGVVGASAARALARAGAEVTVFERTEPGAGTSATSFAWINSHNKDPRSYHDLNVAGMAEHASLAAKSSPQADWFFPTGNLEWASDDTGARRLAESVAELTDRDYPVSWITAEQAKAMVPDVRIPDHVADIAFFPSEGYTIPALLLARMWGEARDRGARLRCPAEVVGITDYGRAIDLRLSTGGHDTFDGVVITAGRWTRDVTAAAGHPVAMTPLEKPVTLGFLGYTAPLAARINHVLTTPRLNVRPDGGGRLVLQGLDLDSAADPANPPASEGDQGHELCARLAEILAGTGGARLESLRVGQRCIPADGRTVAGFVGSNDRIYTIATHSGITLGPLLGRLAAEEILDGRFSDLLADFRPQRLIGVEPDDLPALHPARRPGQQ